MAPKNRLRVKIIGKYKKDSPLHICYNPKGCIIKGINKKFEDILLKIKYIGKPSHVGKKHACKVAELKHLFPLGREPFLLYFLKVRETPSSKSKSLRYSSEPFTKDVWMRTSECLDQFEFCDRSNFFPSYEAFLFSLLGSAMVSDIIFKMAL